MGYRERLFEMAQAQGFDHLGLHRRDVLVGLVGAEPRADDGADSAAALGLTDELDDGLRDIVRIRGVLALERRCQGLEQGVADAADLAVGLGHFGAGGGLTAGEEVGRLSARLHLQVAGPHGHRLHSVLHAGWLA